MTNSKKVTLLPPNIDIDKKISDFINEPANRPANRPIDRPVNRSIDRPVNIPGNRPGNRPGKWLTENQIKVYDYLKNLKDDKTNIEIISKQTGVYYSTVKRALKTLVKFKLIRKPKRFHQGTFRGFKFKLLE